MKKLLVLLMTALFAAGLGAQETPQETATAEQPATAVTTEAAEATLAAPVADDDVAAAANKVALDYAHYLFADGFLKKNNAKKIEGLSPLLTGAQRERLYEENEQLGVKPFLLNLLIGFGIGSFVQGDLAIGHLQLWGDLAGYGLLITGAAVTAASAANDNADGVSAGGVVMTIGSLITLAVTLPACICPWTFSARVNKVMRRALNVDENGKAVGSAKGAAEVSFAPIVQPVTGEYGLMARIAF